MSGQAQQPCCIPWGGAERLGTIGVPPRRGLQPNGGNILCGSSRRWRASDPSPCRTSGGNLRQRRSKIEGGSPAVTLPLARGEVPKFRRFSQTDALRNAAVRRAPARAARALGGAAKGGGRAHGGPAKRPTARGAPERRTPMPAPSTRGAAQDPQRAQEGRAPRALPTPPRARLRRER